MRSTRRSASLIRLVHPDKVPSIKGEGVDDEVFNTDLEETSTAVNIVIDQEVAWLRVDGRGALEMPNSDPLNSAVRQSKVAAARLQSSKSAHMQTRQLKALSEHQKKAAEKEELTAKVRAEYDAEDIGKSMAKALREAEFQEKEARASLDCINAELSAHGLLGAPETSPAGPGLLSTRLPMAGTVPVVSGSTAVGTGTKLASSFLGAWDTTPDVPPPPPSQMVFDETTVKGSISPMEYTFQVSHVPTMNNSSKTPIAVAFDGGHHSHTTTSAASGNASFVKPSLTRSSITKRKLLQSTCSPTLRTRHARCGLRSCRMNTS
jgi:hypothetical protein